jgi:corrinoid protein of di/trimethylamine methyltransferase
MQTQELFQAMAQSIIDGDTDVAAELAKQAIETGVAPLDAINEGFVRGINCVGEEFSRENMFLPELVLAGEAMKAAIGVLEPEMAKEGTTRQIHGKVVLAAAPGDIHDIGKSLVGTMLSASGFQVFDLGVDVPIAAVVERARDVDADIVGVSALLTTTMAGQQEVIEALQAAGLRSKVKVMVGGAPVTPEWAEQIGADAFGRDAVQAVTIARQLVGLQV